jgi:hypothetical protein
MEESLDLTGLIEKGGELAKAAKKATYALKDLKKVYEEYNLQVKETFKEKEE